MKPVRLPRPSRRDIHDIATNDPMTFHGSYPAPFQRATFRDICPRGDRVPTEPFKSLTVLERRSISRFDEASIRREFEDESVVLRAARVTSCETAQGRSRFRIYFLRGSVRVTWIVEDDTMRMERRRGI